MRYLSISCLAVCAAWSVASAQTPAPKPAPVNPSSGTATITPAAPPAVTAPAAAEVPADAVVMSIGDEKITRAQFEAFIAALPEQLRSQTQGANRRRFADQYSEMKAFAWEARHRKLDENPDVKVRMALQMDNLMASELLRTVNAGLKLDDAAIKAYYDQHKSEYEEAKASHILIRFKGSPVPVRSGQKDLTEEEALAKAKAIRERLLKGEDFATVAKAESDDTGSGANGGSLGSFTRERMVPEFSNAAFSLPVGQISEPVKSQFGYHIIKVESRTAKTLDQVKSQIEAKLKPEMMRKAAEEVRKTIPVTVNEQYFGK